MAPAPHLAQALDDAHELARGRDDLPGWRTLEGSTERVLAQLDGDEVDPAYTDRVESDGTLGPDLDPDVVDLVVASITALQETPDEEQLEIALRALTDLELLVR